LGWCRAPRRPATTRAACGGKDVFVHITTLERAGLSKLVEGQRVRMMVGPGEKGPEAMSIELVD
jgi:cold shock protein